MQLALFLGLKESYGVSEDTIDQRLIIYMHLGKSFSRTRLRRATEMKTNAAILCVNSLESDPPAASLGAIMLLLYFILAGSSVMAK